MDGGHSLSDGIQNLAK